MTPNEQIRKLIQWERQRMRLHHEEMIREIPKKLMWIAFLFGLLLLVEHAFASTPPPCLVFMSRARGHSYELTATRDGKRVGHLLYSINGDEAHVGGVYVDPEYRRQGVSIELIQHMLARDPVETIEALLVLDNFEASGLNSATYTSFEDCAKAIKGTPLYRAIAREGFRRVVECRHSAGTESIAIKVERRTAPTPNYL